MTIVIASADSRHVESAARAAESRGLHTTTYIGATAPPAIRKAAARVAGVKLAPADHSYFRGPGIAKIGRRLPVIRRGRMKDAWWLQAETAFDKHTSTVLAEQVERTDTRVFHGFGGFVPASQIVAHDLGLAVINDVFEMHPTYERMLEHQESDFIGIPTPPINASRAQLLARRQAAIASADHVVAGLPSVARSLEWAGVAPDRIVVGHYDVPSWVADSRISRSERDARSDALHLLYVGQIHWYKGLQRLIAAIEVLGDKRVSLTVCGSVYPGPISTALLARLEELSRSTHVNFLGSVSRQKLADEFDKADLLVFPSIVGGVGLAVLEAAAAGVPLGLSDGEGLFVDGESMLSTGTSPESIAGALSCALDDREALEALGQRARATLAGGRSEASYTGALGKLYLELSGQRGSK